MPRQKHKERIVEMLRRNEVVCATDFHRAMMPAARNRISELRQQGWIIRTEQWCTAHNHDSKQVQYRLISEPDPQLTFGGTR